MPRTMMALGDYRFEIATAAYQRLQREHEYRWPVHARIGRVGASQFTGRKPGKIELEGVIYPAFSRTTPNGLDQLRQMRESANGGKPLRLVSGTGRILGKWVIVKVKHVDTVFTDDGRPRKMEFTLELQEYGEDTA